MTFQIERGVPIPADTRGRPNAYPWKQMQIGDSFFAADGHKNNRMTSAARLYGVRHGQQYICRIVTENGVRGVRVWRIA